MSDRFSIRRPGWRRRHFMALGAATVGATAGCLDVFDDDHESSVPAEANFMGRADTAVFEHDPSMELIELILEKGPDVEAIAVMEGFLEDDTLDFADVTDATIFGALDEALSMDPLMAGAVIEAGWSEEDVVSTLETHTGLEYTRTDHGGEDALYEPSNSGTLYLGVLEDGVYVIGDESGVTGALDVAFEGEAGVDSALFSGLEEAPDGFGRLAFVPPRTILPANIEEEAAEFGVDPATFETVELVTATYDASDTEVSLDVRLHTESSRDAETIANLLGAALIQIRQGLPANIAAEVQRIDTNHEEDDRLVEISYESDVDSAALLLDAVLDEIVGGAPDAGAALDVLPSNADGFGTIDPALLTDGDFQDIVSGIVSFLGGELDGEDASELDVFQLSTFEADTGLDFDDVDELAGFAELHEDVFESPDAFGIVFTADWEVEAVVSGMESLTGEPYEVTTHEGEEALYEPAGDGSVFVGQLAGNQYILGNRAAVEATLAVQYADAPGVDEEVVALYEAAGTGDVQGGLRLPGLPVDYFDVFEDVEAATVNYAHGDPNVNGEARLHVTSEQSAEDVLSLIEVLLVSMYSGPAEPEIENIDRQQQETEVSMQYDGTVDGVNLLIDELPDILDL